MSVFFPQPASLALQNFIYNGNPLLLPKWRAGLAKTRAGLAHTRILCIGDSTTFGYGSNGSGTGNLIPLSYPAQLVGLLVNAGVNASWQSFIGGQAGPTNAWYGGNDTRVTVGSVWSATQYPSVGGNLYTAAANTNALSFQPTVNVDTFVIYYVQGTSSSSFGSFNWNVDGGSNTAFATSTGANAVVSTTVSAGSLGSHTLNIKWAANGTIFIAGIEAYDSSKKWILVDNAGWPGSKSADWNSSASGFSPIPALAAMAPGLTIINLGVNDWNNSVSIATYSANMQAIITQALSVGDVLLVSPFPSNPASNASVATQLPFVAALYQLAQANNIPLVDQYNRMVSYASASGLGIAYDGIHPNGAGYADNAHAIASLLLGVV